MLQTGLRPKNMRKYRTNRKPPANGCHTGYHQPLQTLDIATDHHIQARYAPIQAKSDGAITGTKDRGAPPDSPSGEGEGAPVGSVAEDATSMADMTRRITNAIVNLTDSIECECSIPARIRYQDLKRKWEKKNLTNNETARFDPHGLPQALEISEQERASGEVELWKRRQMYKKVKRCRVKTNSLEDAFNAVYRPPYRWM